MAGDESRLLKGQTAPLGFRVYKADIEAFERLRRAYPGISAEALGRVLWRFAVWKAPDLMAEVMRLALEGGEVPGPSLKDDQPTEPDTDPEGADETEVA